MFSFRLPSKTVLFSDFSLPFPYHSISVKRTTKYLQKQSLNFYIQSMQAWTGCTRSLPVDYIISFNSMILFFFLLSFFFFQLSFLLARFHILFSSTFRKTPPPGRGPTGTKNRHYSTKRTQAK